MTTAVARKQRLRTLENEIREGLLEGAEAFYYVGMRLKEIRDDELWKEESFSSWNKYLDSGRLDMSNAHARKFVQSAEYRHAIGVSSNSRKPECQWSHHAFEQLTRVPLEHASRVAVKIEKQAEKQGVKLTGSFVRGIVDHELDRPPRQPKSKAPKDNGDGNVHRYLEQYASEIAGMREALEDVPQAGWLLLNQKWSSVINRLIDECDRLAEFLRGVVR
jgi:hypothetical protein